MNYHVAYISYTSTQDVDRSRPAKDSSFRSPHTGQKSQVGGRLKCTYSGATRTFCWTYILSFLRNSAGSKDTEIISAPRYRTQPFLLYNTIFPDSEHTKFNMRIDSHSISFEGLKLLA